MIKRKTIKKNIINNSGLIPMLVKSIQEQQVQINKLEEKINTFEVTK